MSNKIKIGSQIWMKKNLSVCEFKNGDKIYEARSVEEWNECYNNKIPAYCYYDNSIENGKKYGKLYNGYVILDERGLAPKGWKIPSKSDWELLIKNFGGHNIAGIKLKSKDGWEIDEDTELEERVLGHHRDPDLPVFEKCFGTNESLFCGLPGGYREEDGEFMKIRSHGSWWSVTDPNDLGSQSAFHLSYLNGDAILYPEYLCVGLSVRCIKLANDGDASNNETNLDKNETNHSLELIEEKESEKMVHSFTKNSKNKSDTMSVLKFGDKTGTCYFCGNYSANSGTHHTVRLNKQTDYFTDKSHLEIAKVYIPRCSRCKDIHSGDSDKSKVNNTGAYIVFSLAIISVLVAIVTRNGVFWGVSLLVFFVGLIVSTVNASAQANKIKFSIDRKKSLIKQHIKIKELISQGWVKEKKSSKSAGKSNRKISFLERDNVGLRQDTQGKGEAYFAMLFDRSPESILFYFFPSKENAEKAMVEVPCIHIAEDSCKFICTEIITFGVFPAVDEKGNHVWSALLAGQNLTIETWNAGKSSFIANGGRMRRADKIDNMPHEIKDITKATKHPKNDVEFIKKEDTILAGFPATQEVYEAPNKSVAIEFLKDKIVAENSYFIVVETPEGKVVKDIQGVFDN